MHQKRFVAGLPWGLDWLILGQLTWINVLQCYWRIDITAWISYRLKLPKVLEALYTIFNGEFRLVLFEVGW